MRVGISRGTRGVAAPYRRYAKLNPGPWFNSVSDTEFERLYREQVLDLLDPQRVHDELIVLAAGNTVVLCCYEKPGTGAWCHRSLAARWLSQALGIQVPEFGFEDRPQCEHPLPPPFLQRP